MADVATLSILQDGARRHAALVVGQLQGALGSRVAVEQAKGLLAERLGIDVAAAFEVLRGYARRWRTTIGEVAQRVVDGRLTAERLLAESRKAEAD